MSKSVELENCPICGDPPVVQKGTPWHDSEARDVHGCQACQKWTTSAFLWNLFARGGAKWITE